MEEDDLVIDGIVSITDENGDHKVEVESVDSRSNSVRIVGRYYYVVIYS